MAAIVTTVLALLAQLAPIASGASIIGKIIEALVAIIPAAIQLSQDLKPVIQSIINALKSNGDATPEQLAQLDEISAKADADFEAAATGAEAEDAADAENAAKSLP